MPALKGMQEVCDGCRVRGDLEEIDGQVFDPFTKLGSKSFCAECLKKQRRELHPQVVAAAERAVHALQSLLACELHPDVAPEQAALVFAGHTGDKNGMARRMKRVELLTRMADGVMTIYGNVVGFRLAGPGAFERVDLYAVASRFEELLRAEVAFSEARAERERVKTTGLSKAVGGGWDPDYDDGPRVSGPLFRMQEVAKITQKIAQIAATRAGAFVKDAEDEVVDGAIDAFDDGVFGGRRVRYRNPGGIVDDAVAVQRQMLMVLQKAVEQQDVRQAQQAAPAPRDPVDELNALLDTRERLAAAKRDTRVVDARIADVEAQIAAMTSVESAVRDAVREAVVATASAKDVTPPKALGPAPIVEDDDPPPDDGELDHLRRTLGDEICRRDFPEECAAQDARRAAANGAAE